MFKLNWPHVIGKVDMRRKERDVTSPESINAILTEAKICHLGMCIDNMPYVVPVNFVYIDKKLYIHSSIKGKKIEILRKNPNCCVQVELDGGFIPSADPDDACESDYRYKSLIAKGLVTFIEENRNKLVFLEAIGRKYFGHSVVINEKKAGALVVLEIVLDDISVKQSGHWD